MLRRASICVHRACNDAAQANIWVHRVSICCTGLAFKCIGAGIMLHRVCNYDTLGQQFCCAGPAIMLHRASIWLHRATIWLHMASIWLHRAIIWLHSYVITGSTGVQYPTVNCYNCGI